MQLLFVSTESTSTYFETTRGYLERYGKPLAFYSGKASVFRLNNKQATGGGGQTQSPCHFSGNGANTDSWINICKLFFIQYFRTVKQDQDSGQSHAGCICQGSSH